MMDSPDMRKNVQGTLKNKVINIESSQGVLVFYVRGAAGKLELYPQKVMTE